MSTKHTSAIAHDHAELLRQMALVDRVIGLEAEVARLEAALRGEGTAREEIERLQTTLDDVYASRTWWIGRTVLSPATLVKRIAGRA